MRHGVRFPGPIPRVAIAIVAETCSPFTVLPGLLNEYRIPELNVQNGVLKALAFMFEYIGEMGKDYVTSARVAGAGLWRLMFVTVLPNCLAPIIVQAALSFSTAILDAAAATWPVAVPCARILVATSARSSRSPARPPRAGRPA